METITTIYTLADVLKGHPWAPQLRDPFQDAAPCFMRTLKPGQFMDGDIVRSRCRHCGAVKIKGRCPVLRKDCGR